MAKNRVAPMKGMTLPRLELIAAVIGTQVGKHLMKELDLDDAVFFLSDSQIVLHWIKSNKIKNEFITTRTREIKQVTKNFPWKYIPSDTNPAGLQTRGITAKEFQENVLWKMGPAWLTLSQTTNFRPFQNQGLCRRQFQI